jgi:hypothetical protein
MVLSSLHLFGDYVLERKHVLCSTNAIRVVNHFTPSMVRESIGQVVLQSIGDEVE